MSRENKTKDLMNEPNDERRIFYCPTEVDRWLAHHSKEKLMKKNDIIKIALIEYMLRNEESERFPVTLDELKQFVDNAINDRMKP